MIIPPLTGPRYRKDNDISTQLLPDPPKAYRKQLGVLATASSVRQMTFFINVEDIFFHNGFKPENVLDGRWGEPKDFFGQIYLTPGQNSPKPRLDINFVNPKVVQAVTNFHMI